MAEQQPTVDELRLSLRRIAAADDAERRRLERELHDGAQQRLVAVRVKLGLLRELVAEDADVSRHFDELEAGLNEAFRALRALARDIFPAVLAAEGPAAALRAAAERCPASVAFDCDLGRYPAEIESALYHSCVEAVRHATSAGADVVSVVVGEEGDELVFAVSNGDRGFPGGVDSVEDRLRVVGGRTEIDGATLRGRLPLSGAEAV